MATASVLIDLLLEIHLRHLVASYMMSVVTVVAFSLYNISTISVVEFHRFISHHYTKKFTIRM